MIGNALSALALSAPRPETGWGLPRDVSLDGWRIDWLLNVTMIFVVVLFVIMVIWMLLAVFKHGEKHQAEYDHGSSRHHIKIALTVSALIFFVVDGNLFVNSMVDLDKAFWNFAHAEKAPDAIRVEVNAHQWAWDFRYAGLDGEFGTPQAPSRDDIVELNVLRVPVDTPVILQLAATDVIHSFYLPNLRVKMDAMPGQINRLWFQAKKVGEYDIACAQHCGVNHYKMKGTLVVMSKEDYAKWHAQAARIAANTFDEKDPNAHWGWKWKEAR